MVFASVETQRYEAAQIEVTDAKGASIGTVQGIEVGCGTGSNLDMLKRYGTVDAIEPDAPARALATSRSGIERAA